MSDPPISSELKFRSLEFLKKLEDDLVEANESYKKVAEDIEEYVNVKMFLNKEIELGDKSERNILTNIGCSIYTKAKIPANSKIIVCLIDDIFVEMDYQRADKFIERKLALLNQKLDQIGKQMAAIRGHIMFVHAAMDPSGVLQRIE